MARPKKDGLDYFQLDVSIYEDDKIILAQELVDPDGSNPWVRFAVPAIAIRMLREIFKEGYFIEFNDRAALAISSKMNSVITMNLLKKIVESLLHSGFFDINIYNKYNILTSHGIQVRWLFICRNAKRKNIIINQDIWLTPEETRKTPEETRKTPEETPSYGSKTPHIYYPINNNIIIGNKGKGKNTNNVNNNVDDELTPEETRKTPEETRKTPEETRKTPEETRKTPEETLVDSVHSIETLIEFYFSANSLSATREQVAIINHMDINVLRGWAEAFNRFLITEGTTMKSKSDWAKHFKNWLKYQNKNINPTKLFNEKSEENGKTTKSNSGKQTNGHQPFDMESAISKIDLLLGKDGHK